MIVSTNKAIMIIKNQVQEALSREGGASIAWLRSIEVRVGGVSNKRAWVSPNEKRIGINVFEIRNNKN